MKLIDIEKFDNSKPQLYSDNNYISIEHDICEKMYEFAGVEAIPIEWIEKQIKKHMEQEQWELDAYGECFQIAFAYHYLIEEWRNRNGNN